jgi:predicted dinucleotide-binding enzyme
MTFAVLGTGSVGRAIASKLVSLGHDTWMGSRTADHEGAAAWSEDAGPLAQHGTFHDAASRAEVVVLAVAGQHALSVVEAAGDALHGKVLLDLTNPLDFSKGFPPRLSVGNDDSLGEQIQRAVPQARVVKTLNTLANELMVAPEALPEPTEVFVAGDDDEAKRVAAGVLRSFGHGDPIDLGGIDASRGLEAWLLLWTRLYGTLGTGRFNLKLVRAD